MSKGLSLEQFREQLESDAQKRCDAQGKTIKELQEKLKSKDLYIEAIKERIKRLENKCFVGHQAVLCIFCMDRALCTAWAKHNEKD